jgi:hypothetical protein
MVARDGDQTEARVVLTHPGHGADAVEARHVEVDHDGLRLEFLDELDRLEPVTGDAHNV